MAINRNWFPNHHIGLHNNTLREEEYLSEKDGSRIKVHQNNIRKKENPELKLESGVMGDYHAPFGGRQSTEEDEADPTILYGHARINWGVW